MSLDIRALAIVVAGTPAPRARKAAGPEYVFTWVEESSIQGLVPRPGFLKAVTVKGERSMHLEEQL